jgi:hypothetical protein
VAGLPRAAHSTDRWERSAPVQGPRHGAGPDAKFDAPRWRPACIKYSAQPMCSRLAPRSPWQARGRIGVMAMDPFTSTPSERQRPMASRPRQERGARRSAAGHRRRRHRQDHTIAHRVAHLVVNGVDPARMLLLTFTRRAALRDAPARARHRASGPARHAGQQGAGDAAAAGLGRHLSFHRQPAAAPLRAPAEARPVFTVIDRGDSADLLDTLRQELGLASKDQRFPRKDTCLAIYSWRVNTQKSLRETLEQQFPWCKDWERI